MLMLRLWDNELLLLASGDSRARRQQEEELSCVADGIVSPWQHLGEVVIRRNPKLQDRKQKENSRRECQKPEVFIFS